MTTDSSNCWDDGSPRYESGPLRISDEEALSRLRAVVESAGADGMSPVEASQRAGVFLLRALELMDRHFIKSGAGKETRYRLK